MRKIRLKVDDRVFCKVEKLHGQVRRIRNGVATISFVTGDVRKIPIENIKANEGEWVAQK